MDREASASVTHGGLRDFSTVRAMDVVTMEERPRVVHHEGEAVHEILHAWGTNGIITRIWLALTPAVEWAQCSVAFDTFDQGFEFSQRIAASEDWTKSGWSLRSRRGPFLPSLVRCAPWRPRARRLYFL